MARSRLNSYVRRYTTLSSAIDTLVNHKLVLLSPSKWDDTNDIAFMEQYRAAKQDDIAAWLNANVKSGYAQATVNRWQVILSHMMRLAKRWGVPGAEINPLEGVVQKDPNNRVERYLS